MNQESIWMSSDELLLWSNRASSSLCSEEAQIFNYLRPLISTDKHIVEHGTGAGRISFNLYKQGYKSIDAYDISPKLIAQAKSIHSSTPINFAVSDVTALDVDYSNCSCVIFLQQLLSLIPRNSISSVIDHALRSLPSGSYLVFSLLNRRSSPKILAASYFTYVLRLLQFESPRFGYLPYFTLGDKFNYRFYQQTQETSYWFSDSDIKSLFRTFPSEIYNIVGSSHPKLFDTQPPLKISSQTGFYYFLLQAK